MADRFTRNVFHTVRGVKRYAYSPTLPGTGVGGVALLTGAGAWGAWTDVSAGAVATGLEYWVCGIAVYTPDQVQVWQLQLGTAAGAITLAEFMINITAATVNVNPLLVPYPIYRPAAAVTTARSGGAGAGKTITGFLIYAVGL